MDEIYKKQVEFLLEFRREYANFNKTSRGRKTTKYRDAKQEVLKRLYEEYNKIHSEVRRTKTPSAEYENNHLEIKELYNKWSTGLQAIKEPTALEPDPADEPELAAQLKQQNVRFKSISKDLNTVMEKVKKNEELSKAYCKMRIATITALWERIIIANENFLADVGVPPVGYEDRLADIEELHDQVMVILQGKLDEADNQTQNGQDGVKLQRVTIPKFTGDYCKWVSFRDLFTTMVIEKGSISDAQKLQLLKTYVGGEVEGLIADLSISNANFQAAWMRLTERYDNNRVIVYRYMNKLFTQQIVKGDAQSLKKLLDTTEQILLALKNIGRPTDHWDDWIVMIITQKMCDENRKDWEKKIAESRDLPTWMQLKTFLEEEFRMLEGVESGQQRRYQQNYPAKQNKPSFIKSYQTTVERTGCPTCGNDHKLFSCNEFKKMTPKNRWEMAKKANLCFKCLKSGHDKGSCEADKADKPCKHCTRPHSTWLHEERKPRKGKEVASNAATKESNEVAVNVVTMTKPQVLLATALINTKAANGETIRLRALVDSGSQGSMMTTRAAGWLNWSPQKSRDQISPLGEDSKKVSQTITIKIGPHFSQIQNVEVECYLMKKLTKTLPNEELYTQAWKHIKGLKLADPTFHKVGAIDMLLGMDVINSILEEGLIKGPKGEPMAQKTTFGWIISGKIDSTYNPKVIQCAAAICDGEVGTTDLKQFWELEELHPRRMLTPAEQAAEKHFMDNFKKQENGRVIVKIPFKEAKEGPEQLGLSKNQAVARFKQLEVKFSKNPELKKEYERVMEEYIDMGHMRLVNQEDEKLYYIPHHAVIKPDSLTTKVRVVFDASAKTSSGKSLNDCMWVGGKTQDDLFEILIRWRKHRIVFKADIEKMYRKIQLDKKDQRYHTVIWRKSPQEELKEYQLTTVTFGTAAAPFLATRTLQQLAQESQQNYPETSGIITKDFYVDDLISGCDSVRDAVKRKTELLQVLGGSDLHLRKWTSNSQQFLDTLPTELTEKALQRFDSDDTTKALGLQWNPRSDKFSFQITWCTDDDHITKRRLLSDASKLFDPLGWLSPTVIHAKLMMQAVWRAKTSWDEEVRPDIAVAWKQFKEELPLLGQISIDRWVRYDKTADIQLHGFCDASEKAYAAAVYTRVQYDDKVEIKLITSKTRVAPVHLKTTLPRLELCGAVLLANLMRSTKEALQLDNVETIAWCDSMITLGWLKGEPNKWKTFVANRVSDIQSSQIADWRYVKSEDNPADCASRGVMPSELKAHPLWWEGPKWLKEPKNSWPNIESSTETMEEKRLVVNVGIVQRNELRLGEASWFKRVRLTAYCLRMRRKQSRSATLTFHELQEAENVLYKRCQQEVFPDEMTKLSNGQPIAAKSMLLQLNPFLDSHGVMRVGGRLKNADWTFGHKHPIILPNNHDTTHQIMEQMHLNTLHGGPLLMLGLLRKKYWIIQAKRMVTSVFKKCVHCRRSQAQCKNQIMGDLPKERVTLERAFLTCGVDYCGPLEVRTSRIRGAKVVKGYIAVFTCFGTKAVHLELVSDMTTQAFIAAFNRFTARRGMCRTIYSDNGSNLVGAANKMKDDENKWLHTMNVEIAAKCQTRGTEWKFIPPGSPNFGGLWERAVRSVKQHLYRTLQTSKLTFEEYATVLCQIEAALNSRPLCPLTNDTENLNVLTPGHFLVGDALLAIPQLQLQEKPANMLDRWRYLQVLQQQFWHRWNTEYLSQLQTRSKWKKGDIEVNINDLVIVKDENLPPRNWLMGRVMEKWPGKDGKVRVVTLRTQKGEFKRPVCKLCPLLPYQEENLDKDQNEEALKEAEAEEIDIPKGHPRKSPQARKTDLIQHKPITRSARKKCETQTTAPRYNLRPRVPNSFVMMATVLLVMLLFGGGGALPSNPEKAVKIETFSQSPGIYFEDMGKVNPIKTNWKMYIYFSLEQYNYELKRLTDAMADLDRRCRDMGDDAGYHCQEINAILAADLDGIRKLNVLLRSNGATQRRSKRSTPFSGVGWLGHQLFGVMAEDEALEIEEKIEVAKKNTEKLHEMINNQTSVIEGTLTLIKSTEKEINQHYGELDRTMGIIINDSDGARRRERAAAVAVLASILVNRFEKTQRTILDMLTEVYQGHISSYVFTPDQLKEQLVLINNNLPSSTKLPDDDTHDLKSLYRVMRARTRVLDSQILVEITLPLASTVDYQMYNVVPIPTTIGDDYITLIPDSKYLLITLKKDSFYQMSEKEFQNCIQPSNQNFICAFKFPVYNLQSNRSKCERDLMAQEPELSKQCRFRTSPREDFWIQLQEKNHWLYGLIDKATLNVVCDQELHTISLEGSGILEIRPGCEIIQPGMTITAESEKQSEGTGNFFPTLNLSEAVVKSGQQRGIKVFNMTLDHSEQLQHLHEQLEYLKSNSELDTFHRHTNTALSTTFLVTILGVAVLLWFKGRVLVLFIMKWYTSYTQANQSDVERQPENDDNAIELRTPQFHRNSVDRHQSRRNSVTGTFLMEK